MKYVIVLGDGMADVALPELDGMTPLEYARTENLDRLAKLSEIGRTKPVPEGMKPGSDVANLAVMGYDPRKYYSGRSPLEALSIGVPMADTDIAIRCNVVTLSEGEMPYEDRIIVDHSAGEISTEDSAELLAAVQKEMENEIYQFYVGTSYRHCLIWKNGSVVELVPPHDQLGKACGPYLPADEMLLAMMKRSYEILVNHPINIKRRENGQNPANSLWFWGAGVKPILTSFEEKNGKKGVMISAVDLLKGIAVGASMRNIEVEGANGQLETNYEGKAQAAIDALIKEGYDFAYVHLEAPDEMGHQGSVEKKVKAIEYLDSRIVGPIEKGLTEAGVEFRMLVLPDHPTPIPIRTHTPDPIPYLLYDSSAPQEHDWCYNEKEAEKSPVYHEHGYQMMDLLFSK